MGGWVGGWVGWVEEEQAVRLRCWELGVGRWVGKEEEDFTSTSVGGWVGGWVSFLPLLAVAFSSVELGWAEDFGCFYPIPGWVPPTPFGWVEAAVRAVCEGFLA